VAELAILQTLTADPTARVFYLAPFRSLALEVERIDRARGEFQLRAGTGDKKKDLLAKPIVVNALIGARAVRVGVFGTAPQDTAWKLKADNVQITSTEGGR
jgi:hypothetical protein